MTLPKELPYGGVNEPRKSSLFENKILKGRSVKDIFHIHDSQPEREEITDARWIASPYFTKAFFEVNP